MASLLGSVDEEKAFVVSVLTNERNRVLRCGLPPSVSLGSPACEANLSFHRKHSYACTIRRTHEDCSYVRSILRGFRVAVDERDVSLDAAYRGELQALLGSKGRPVPLPQVFVRGRHVGGAEEVRQLHETGELGRLLEGVAVQDPAYWEPKVVRGGGGQDAAM
ncbi:hypothetical protein HPP92_003587 [Vanilla planifolia]|uniref:Glutaredoxin domain-containing protein n=1 Tax=Vanilla planifolia TaxID=51239 RepID=A0A835VJJ7_VANPL|nr:hypothetical protein HPP92_003587 [Vanilla planifolia]